MKFQTLYHTGSPVIISPYGSCLSAAEVRQHSISPLTTTSLQNINQVFSQELNDALDKFNISVTPEHHTKHGTAAVTCNPVSGYVYKG